MISFCVLTEIFGPLIPGINNRLEYAMNDTGKVLNARNYGDANSWLNAMISHRSLVKDAYQDVKGGDSGHRSPSDSWWSWVPFSNESEAENNIEDLDHMIRKVKRDPKWWATYHHGEEAPSFWSHPFGNTADTIAEHPYLTLGGLGASAYGLYKAKQYYDKKKQEKQMSQGLSGFSGDSY